MRISDWSSDGCSSDLLHDAGLHELQRIAGARLHAEHHRVGDPGDVGLRLADAHGLDQHHVVGRAHQQHAADGELGEAAEPVARRHGAPEDTAVLGRSEEHTSELQSLMRISYAVFCLETKKTITRADYDTPT